MGRKSTRTCIDWDKFLPRFNQFKAQEAQSKVRHGFA